MANRFMPLEVKFASEENDEMTFAGYGAVFGNMDSYGDIIKKGAFKETLKTAKSSGNWPLMLSQHGGFTSEDMTPIGVWTEMKEDENGLYLEGRFADTPRGREAYTLAKMKPRPAINGLSIGYRAKKFSMGDGKEARRYLEEIDLFEVSLVSMPANPEARIQSVKSLDARALEASLRGELNLSQRDAVSAVALMKKHLREEGENLPDTSREGVDMAELAALIRRNIQTLKG